MKNVTEKSAMTVKKRLFPFLWALAAVCALLQVSPAAAEEAVSTRPLIFDSSPFVEAGYTADYLTNHASDWHSQYVNISIPLKAFGLVNVRAENVERFGLSDQVESISYAFPCTIGVITLDGSYTGNPNFLAKNSVGVVWNGKLPEGFGYTLGAAQRNYSDLLLNIYTVGVEENVGQFRIAYTASFSAIGHSASEFSGMAQLLWISNGNNRIGLTYSEGVEPTVVSVGNLASIQTQYIQLDGLCWLTKKVGVTTAFWHSKEGHYYQHNGGQLGLRISL
jgi:YaiO family outer membrane protein